MILRRAGWRVASFLAVLCIAAVTAPFITGAEPPDEGECPAISPRGPDGKPETDATALIIKEGMRVDSEGLMALQTLLPREIWRHRESFFFEGMLMEIGPCHRRYPSPQFYEAATTLHAGKASLDERGNLEHFVAGSKAGTRVVSGCYHIQNVNSLHARYKRFMKPLSGPVTKNLSG